MNLPEIGQKIRDARRKLALTQIELSKPLRMSRATISQIENGTIGELGFRKLLRICDRLGLELSVRERRPPILHEAYERNRKERLQALQETDAILSRLKPDGHD